MQVDTHPNGTPPKPGPPVTAARQQDPAAVIDEAVVALDDLDELPVADRVARFDAVHAALNEALATIDQTLRQ